MEQSRKKSVTIELSPKKPIKPKQNIRKKSISNIALQMVNVKKVLKNLTKPHQKMQNSHTMQKSQQDIFKENIQFFKQVPLFKTYTHFQIKKLIYRGKQQNINYNTKVLEQGCQDRGFFIIKSGVFHVQKKINTRQINNQQDLFENMREIEKFKDKKKPNFLKQQLTLIKEEDLQSFKSPSHFRSFQLKILSKNDFFGEEEILNPGKASSYDVICKSTDGGEVFWWPKKFFTEYISKDLFCLNAIQSLSEEKNLHMQNSFHNIKNQMNHYGEFLYQDLNSAKLSLSEKKETQTSQKSFFKNLSSTKGIVYNLNQKSQKSQISFQKPAKKSPPKNLTLLKDDQLLPKEQPYSPQSRLKNHQYFTFSKRAQTAKVKKRISSPIKQKQEPSLDIFQNQSLKEIQNLSSEDLLLTQNYSVKSSTAIVHKRAKSSNQKQHSTYGSLQSSLYKPNSQNYIKNMENTRTNTEFSWQFKSIQHPNTINMNTHHSQNTHSNFNSNNMTYTNSGFHKPNVVSDHTLAYSTYGGFSTTSNHPEDSNTLKNTLNLPSQDHVYIQEDQNTSNTNKSSQQDKYSDNNQSINQKAYQKYKGILEVHKKRNSIMPKNNLISEFNNKSLDQNLNKQKSALHKLLGKSKNDIVLSFKEKKKQFQEEQKQNTENLLSSLKIKSPYLDSRQFTQQLQSALRRIRPKESFIQKNYATAISTSQMQSQTNQEKSYQSVNMPVRQMIEKIQDRQEKLNTSQPKIRFHSNNKSFNVQFVNNSQIL